MQHCSRDIPYLIIYDSAFAVSTALSLPFFFPLEELLPRFLCEGLDPEKGGGRGGGGGGGGGAGAEALTPSCGGGGVFSAGDCLSDFRFLRVAGTSGILVDKIKMFTFFKLTTENINR